MYILGLYKNSWGSTSINAAIKIYNAQVKLFLAYYCLYLEKDLDFCDVIVARLVASDYDIIEGISYDYNISD